MHVVASMEVGVARIERGLEALEIGGSRRLGDSFGG